MGDRMTMDISPIRSDEDHAAALEQIDRLWGVDPDTAEGARLEILLTLVDTYEETHHAIPQSDPASAIEFMRASRLTPH
jgi:HTH-type transcriptional regulator/antitoxin HigA